MAAADPSHLPSTTSVPAWCRFEATEEGGGLVIGGAWVLVQAVAFDDALRKFSNTANGPAVTIDMREMTRLDTSGAWLLVRTSRALARRGIEVTHRDVPEAFRRLLFLVARQPDPPVGRAAERRGLVAVLEGIGRISAELAEQALALFNFFGRMVVDGLTTIGRPGSVHVAAIVNQIMLAGMNALPILALLSFLIGVIMAYQGAAQFHRYGADIYTVNLVSVAAVREIGVMMATIIVAGRSGSAFTAELGVMVVDEEIDAIETMGLNLIHVLILPRMLALIIALPLLTFFANVLCILGGAVTCFLLLHIPFEAFLHQLQGAAGGWSFWLGLMKAPFFGMLIATVACLEGLRVERNAASVGRMTTRAVVESLFLVMLTDAIFSVVFQVLDI